MWLSASCKFKGSFKDEKSSTLFFLTLETWVNARQKKILGEEKFNIANVWD